MKDVSFYDRELQAMNVALLNFMAKPSDLRRANQVDRIHVADFAGALSATVGKMDSFSSYSKYCALCQEEKPSKRVHLHDQDRINPPSTTRVWPQM
jgi:hypothetical protein